YSSFPYLAIPTSLSLSCLHHWPKFPSFPPIYTYIHTPDHLHHHHHHHAHHTPPPPRPRRPSRRRRPGARRVRRLLCGLQVRRGQGQRDALVHDARRRRALQQRRHGPPRGHRQPLHLGLLRLQPGPRHHHARLHRRPGLRLLHRRARRRRLSGRVHLQCRGLLWLRCYLDDGRNAWGAKDKMERALQWLRAGIDSRLPCALGYTAQSTERLRPCSRC
ncbi:hypothetical protein F4778DRAFT_292561, partial [Xylariomycetidae sp. FL2044]